MDHLSGQQTQLERHTNVVNLTTCATIHFQVLVPLAKAMDE